MARAKLPEGACPPQARFLQAPNQRYVRAFGLDRPMRSIVHKTWISGVPPTYLANPAKIETVASDESLSFWHITIY
jgi:hypothetical protein